MSRVPGSDSPTTMRPDCAGSRSGNVPRHVTVQTPRSVSIQSVSATSRSSNGAAPGPSTNATGVCPGSDVTKRGC